jgi:hypothetical protein
MLRAIGPKEAGASAAKAMKVQLDSRMTGLTTLLTSVLVAPHQLTIAMLKRSAKLRPSSLVTADLSHIVHGAAEFELAHI